MMRYLSNFLLARLMKRTCALFLGRWLTVETADWDKRVRTRGSHVRMSRTCAFRHPQRMRIELQETRGVRNVFEVKNHYGVSGTPFYCFSISTVADDHEVAPHSKRSRIIVTRILGYFSKNTCVRDLWVRSIMRYAILLISSW